MVEGQAEEARAAAVDLVVVEVPVARAEGKVGLAIKAAPGVVAEAVGQVKGVGQVAVRVAPAADKVAEVAGDSAAGQEVEAVPVVAVARVE